MAEIHPITGMPLEDGRGALPPDDQARVLHIPYIRQTQGDKAADAMLAKIDFAAKGLKLTEAEAVLEEINKDPT